MTLLAALAVFGAVLFSQRPDPVRRLGRSVAETIPERSFPLALIGAVGIAGLVALVFDGSMRWAWAAAAALIAWRILSRSAGSNDADHEAIREQLPLLVDLMSAGLRAGQPVDHAMRVAASAVGPPLSKEALRLIPPVNDASSWRTLARHPHLGAIGRTIQRSTQSGSAIGPSFARLADEVRRDVRAQAEERARRVGVRTVLPLGVCFLPAFMLLGVAPTIIGALSSMSW